MQPKETLLPTGIEEIKTKIHEIRGQKVMIDADLAQLYQVETKYLKRAVKSNIERFPTDFMFELTKEEEKCLRCNFCTSNPKGGNRYTTMAFTEEGVAMLAGLLRSSIAIQTNINIMRAFVLMKNNLSNVINHDIRFENIDMRFAKLQNYIDDVLHDQNDINEDTATQLELINQTLAELQTDRTTRKNFENRKPIGFKIENK